MQIKLLLLYLLLLHSLRALRFGMKWPGLALLSALAVCAIMSRLVLDLATRERVESNVRAHTFLGKVPLILWGFDEWERPGVVEPDWLRPESAVDDFLKNSGCLSCLRNLMRECMIS